MSVNDSLLAKACGPICVTVFVVNNRKNNNEIVMEEKLQEIVTLSRPNMLS